MKKFTLTFLGMTPKTLTLTKLAVYIGFNKRTVHNMIRDGRFPVEPIRGTKPRLWSTEMVDRWITKQKGTQ